MKSKIIILAFLALLLFAGCKGNSKQPESESTQQTETVDTNKVYELWEIDEPPVMPS